MNLTIRDIGDSKIIPEEEWKKVFYKEKYHHYRINISFRREYFASISGGTCYFEFSLVSIKKQY